MATAISNPLGPQQDSATAQTSLVRGYVLTILVSLNFGACQAGRLLLGLLTEPVKAEMLLSDAQLGVLTGISYGVAWSVFLLPSARLADRFNRQACLLGFGLIYVLATLLSAMASGFWELLALRTLVAAGEACLLSVTVSLIGDFLPPTKRPMGFAIFTGCTTLMIFINFVGAGWLESQVTWRGVITYFGIGYSVLLSTVLVLVREPGRSDPTAPPPLRTVVTALLRKPTFLMLVGLACLYVFGIMSAMNWTPAFLIRTHAFSQEAAANFLGMTIGLLAGVVVLVSGVILVRARERSVAGPLRVSMCVAITVVGLYLVGLLAPGSLALVCLGVALAISPVVNSTIISSVQDLAEPSYRASATAMLIIPDAILGGGAGIFLTGLLSDIGVQRYGNESIRYALLLTVAVSWAIAAFLYWRSSRSIKRDAVAV
jgi:predicted MFS family arabinose efflux permease